MGWRTEAVKEWSAEEEEEEEGELEWELETLFGDGEVAGEEGESRWSDWSRRMIWSNKVQWISEAGGDEESSGQRGSMVQFQNGQEAKNPKIPNPY